MSRVPFWLQYLRILNAFRIAFCRLGKRVLDDFSRVIEQEGCRVSTWTWWPYFKSKAFVLKPHSLWVLRYPKEMTAELVNHPPNEPNTNANSRFVIFCGFQFLFLLWIGKGSFIALVGSLFCLGSKGTMNTMFLSTPRFLLAEVPVLIPKFTYMT